MRLHQILRDGDRVLALNPSGELLREQGASWGALSGEQPEPFNHFQFCQSGIIGVSTRNTWYLEEGAGQWVKVLDGPLKFFDYNPHTKTFFGMLNKGKCFAGPTKGNPHMTPCVNLPGNAPIVVGTEMIWAVRSSGVLGLPYGESGFSANWQEV